MIPKSCRLFGSDHASEQMLGAKSRFNLRRFRSKRARPSHAASLAQHDANEIRRVLGNKFFHDMNAMDLDGPRADTKILRRLLVGGGGRDLAQHVVLARREPIAAREGSWWGFAAVAILVSLVAPAIDRFAHARDHRFGI